MGTSIYEIRNIILYMLSPPRTACSAIVLKKEKLLEINSIKKCNKCSILFFKFITRKLIIDHIGAKHFISLM